MSALISTRKQDLLFAFKGLVTSAVSGGRIFCTDLFPVVLDLKTVR